MPTYHITWSIELDAQSPRDAAQHALNIHRDHASSATVFDVIEHDGADTVRVDLDEAEEEAAVGEVTSAPEASAAVVPQVFIQVECDDIQTFRPRFARLAVRADALSARVVERAALAKRHHLAEVLGEDTSVVWESHAEFWRYELLLCVTPEIFWFEGRPAYGRSFRTVALSVEAFAGEVASGREVFGDVDADALAFART